MAELICKDGTKIKISDETEQELRKAFGGRELKHGDVFLNTICGAGSQIRIVLEDNDKWTIFAEKMSHIKISGTKKEVENYINSRDGKNHFNNYVYQYNIFEK